MKKILLVLGIITIVGLFGFIIDKTLIPHEAKVLFVGDMMFDRHIRKVAGKNGQDSILNCVKPLLESVDFAVGNLEGPITSNPSVSMNSVIDTPDNYVFTFPPETAKLLKKFNFDAVNIGNNHIGNFGLEGVGSTRKFLEQAGVGHFGGVIPKEPILRKEINGVKLSFISFNQFGGMSRDKVAENIKIEKNDGRIVIVYAHWGEEYTETSSRMRETATLFAKAGADVVIGSHPHIILSDEHIGNTLIYYSLGNFVFDQYWDEKVSNGLALTLIISKDKIAVEEHKVTLSKNGSTCVKM